MLEWSRVMIVGEDTVAVRAALEAQLAKQPGLFELVAGSTESARVFKSVAECLDAQPSGVLARTACVVDMSVDALQSWDIEADFHHMHPSWLACLYPEVYWIFVVNRLEEVKDKLGAAAIRMHFVLTDDLANNAPGLVDLVRRHVGGMRTWYDPWELRRRAIGRATSGTTPQFGVVLDEESVFVAFNGYLLYRQGIATALVPTEAEFKALADDHWWNEGKRLTVLEDIELNYADASKDLIDRLFVPTEEKRQEALQQRSEWLGTAKAATRSEHVYVSSTQVHYPNRPVVFKPFAGLYDLDIRRYLDLETPLARTKGGGGRHSAPGTHQALAEALVTRLRAYPEPGSDTVAALLGALLAFEAERLLGYQTFALALECLTLRYGLEASAECSFAGVSDELLVLPRVCDLRERVSLLVNHGRLETNQASGPAASESFYQRARRLKRKMMQSTYSMLEVLGKLRDVYASHRKTEEEEYTLHQLRWYRLRAFTLRCTWSSAVERRVNAKRPGRRPLGLLRMLEGGVRVITAVPIGYTTALLKPTALLLSLSVIACVFAVLFREMSIHGDLPGTTCWTNWDWLRHSLVTLVAMQQGIIGDPSGPKCLEGIAIATTTGFAKFWTLTVCEMALGYFHLALLVALLMQKIMRR